MRYVFLPALLLLPACEPIFQGGPLTQPPRSVEDGPPPPPEDARTVEEFDTTSDEERRAAAAATGGGASLGTTVASLGDAGTPGFWMETPLVDAPAKGRIRYAETGRSVQVDLRPADGSSRVSLAALRLLGAPLTELVTLEVYRN